MKKIFVLILLYILISARPSYAAAEYGTEVFAQNASYLVQERFHTFFGTEILGKNASTLSGWDIDYRGGRVVAGDGGLQLLDGDNSEKVSMHREFMPHSGDLTFEYAFKLTDTSYSDFYCSISGADEVLRLEVKDGVLCYIHENGGYTELAGCVSGTDCYVKGTISPKNNTAYISVNGKAPYEMELKHSTDVLSSIEFGTGIETDTYVTLKYVNIYINYLINEGFNTVPAGTLPYDWTANSKNCYIENIPGTDYASDSNVLTLSNTESSPDVLAKKNIIFDEGGVLGFSANFSKSGNSSASLKYNDDAVLEIKTDGTNIYANDIVIAEKYSERVWYYFTVKRCDGGKYTIDINRKNTPIEIQCTDSDINTFEIRKNGSGYGKTSFDDITAEYITEYEDYPSPPQKADSDGYELGMVIYPMWREGIHFGYDSISAYADSRKPYLGYYTEGSVEAADWDNKWLVEHGIDYAIYPFIRPASETGGPIKSTIRGEAFHNGYMQSKYSSELDFAVMLSAVSASNYFGTDDFIDNVIEYWTEYYFKDPRYKIIDNKPIVYLYSMSNMISIMGDGDTQKGIEAFNIITEALRRRVRELGFSDIIMAASGMSDEIKAALPYIYNWKYDWQTDNPYYQIKANDNMYNENPNSIAQVSQGYDTTPWRISRTGMMTPAQMRLVCEHLAEKEYSNHLITFDTWNEYGEGHYFAPTTLHGFDYLNVIRDVFTGSGIKTDEQIPDDSAIARMGVLYPQGRQTLKTHQDRLIYTENELSKMNPVTVSSFENENDISSWKTTRCKLEYDSENQAMKGTATASDSQVSVYISDLGIDLERVNAVRITCYSAIGGGIWLYLMTDGEAAFSSDRVFTGTAEADTEYRTYVLNILDKSAMHGTALRMRVDFEDSLYMNPDNTFGIKKIEFLCDHKDYSVELNGEKISLVSDVISGETLYVPAYKFLLSNIGAYPVWDFPTKTLTVQLDGTEVAFTADRGTYKVNGIEKNCSNAPFYEDGNLYIAYDDILREFGYTAEYNSEENLISFAKDTISEEISPLAWNFNGSDTQGWTTSKAVKIKADKGALRISCNIDDPIVSRNGISFEAAQYNYFILRIKNETNDRRASVRFISEDGTMLSYPITLNNNREYNEYIVSLNENSAWQSMGNITGIRIDPCEGIGVTYIDKFAVTEGYPALTYTMDAYSLTWSDNIIPQLTSSDISYFGGSNLNGFSGTELPVEQLNGDTVLKIAPADSEKDTLFYIRSVDYKSPKQSINELCNDKRIVKLEFEYMAYGNCDEFVVENRKASNDITYAEHVYDADKDEWRKYSVIFDMSEYSTDAKNLRWLCLRVKKNNPGLYIRNINVSYADEDKTDTVSNKSVAIRTQISNYTAERLDLPNTLIIARYDGDTLTDIIDFVNADCAAIVNESHTYVYEFEEETEIKAFWFRDLEGIYPLTEKLKLKIK